jgi:hypothetical protein
MKTLSHLTIFIICLLFNMNVATSTTEVRAMSCVDFEEQFKAATRIMPSDARAYINLLIQNDMLSRDEIAEALRCEESTVDNLIAGDTCYALCKRLKSYMSLASVSLSHLKAIHERDDIDDCKDIEEEEYLRSKTKILLPRKLKNKTKVVKFLKDLTHEDPHAIRTLEKSLCLKTNSLDLFLSSNNKENMQVVINALRDYYWSEDVVPLRDVAAQTLREKENSAWWVVSLLYNKPNGTAHAGNLEAKDK